MFLEAPLEASEGWVAFLSHRRCLYVAAVLILEAPEGWVAFFSHRRCSLLGVGGGDVELYE